MLLKVFIAEVAFCQRQLDEFTAQRNVAATEDVAHRSGKFEIFSIAGNEVEAFAKLLKVEIQLTVIFFDITKLP